jgi:hypothetical protein
MGGCCTAAARQLKYILGYSIPRADKVHQLVAAYIEGMEGFIWQEWIMGSCLLTLVTCFFDACSMFKSSWCWCFMFGKTCDTGAADTGDGCTP